MHKNTFFYAILILFVYFAIVYCEENTGIIGKNDDDQNNDMELSDTKELQEVESRTRKRHGFHRWGWQALAIAYWIKVKLVIVSFFLGSAIFVGLRYFWPHKCTPEIVYDHPPSFHHDHIPYSFDHSDHIADHHSSFDPSSLEPYSGYSSYSSASADIITSDPSPTGPAEIHRIGRRSANIKDKKLTNKTMKRQMQTEEQIANFLFMFLGLDSMPCRRRFICEMEFRSKSNPLTSMAFRIVGRGFFEKYTNARNPQGRANNFFECAAVNPECVFIEQNIEEEDDEAITQTPAAAASSDQQHSNGVPEDQENEITPILDKQTEENTIESLNQQNIKAEKQRSNRLKRRRGDRQLDTIAEHILTQIQ